MAEQNRKPSPPRPGGEVADDEIDLWLLVEIFRRRWILIVAVTLAATLLGAAYAFSRPDLYTAAALVQKLERSSPLSSMASELPGGAGLTPSTMASEVELLNSEAVLGQVVETLALNLQLPGNPTLRRALLGGATVEPPMRPGDFVVRREGDRLRLIDSFGAPVSTAGRGEVLQGPGFTIPVDELPDLEGDVALEVLSILDATDDLREDLSITQAENTTLIRIRFTSRDPEFSADVVNAVAESYWNRAAAVAREEATRRKEFLADQLATVADSVQRAQGELASFQQESRVLNPASEGESMAATVRVQEAEVRQLSYQQSLLQSLMASLSQDGAGDGLERIVTLSEDVVPGGAISYQRLRELQDERRRLTTDRYGYRESSSRVAVLDSLIEETRDQLRSLAQEALSLTGSRLADARSELSQLRSEVGALPAQATEMSRLEQNADAVLATFSQLSERYYEAQVAEAVASADVEIVDTATAPVRPDERNTLLPILLAGILGLGGGGFGAVALEGMDKTIRRSGDAESATGLSVLGMVPQVDLPDQKDGSPAPMVVGDGNEGSPASEAFRTLPTMIRYARTDEVRLIAVTSQGPSEGKSFTAANLAMAMAGRGTRTLLIDCDLHRPKVDLMLGLERSPGLSDVLSRQAAWEDAVRPVAFDGAFSVMPAGTRAPDPAQLLSSPRFKALLDRAKADFGAVILDTPPVLAVSEVLEISELVDGVILVARAEQTNRFALSEAANRLRTINAPMLGLVLNGVQLGKGSAYGGYYYQYYAYDYASKKKNGSRPKV